MTAESSAPVPAPGPARPVPLVVGAAITALEGAALAVVGVLDMVHALTSDAKNLGLHEFGGLLIVLLGVFPLLAGQALLKGRRWGRSPALLTNSICLPVAYYMGQSGGPMVAVAAVIGLLGLAGIGSLLNPRVTATLYGPRED
ncbi:hypothetical protein ACGFZP_06335 [Kitasatospora sp. NPDC048239]|uniref:hypothetical protein n=1 Tax=Kitasatospora sp. NPDC048239 TaxID=3364046 RepID=UPI0037209B41